MNIYKFMRNAGRNNDQNKQGCLIFLRSLQRDFWKLITLFILFIGLAFSVTTANAQTGDDTVISFHHHVSLGRDWDTRLDLFNVGKDISAVRLFAYDAKGQLLGEIPTRTPLGGGERRTYSQASWPQGTVSIQVESSSFVSSLMTLQSKDGTGLEHVIPSVSPTETLVFPVPQIAGERVWSRLALLNTGSVSARLQIISFDQEGRALNTATLPNLDSMEQITVVPRELFGSSIYDATATLHVVGDQPLAGFQVTESDTRADVARLSSTSGLGQEVLLPIFQQGQGVDLWTVASLLNIGDDLVSVTAEALDSDGQSLGVLTEPSFLPGRGMRNLMTANIRGTLPTEAAFLKITADQPIRGIALIGASKAQGLTIVGALTERDGIHGYELLGTENAQVLAALPLMLDEKGTPQSVLSDLGTRFWKRSVRRAEMSTTAGRSQSPAAAALTCSSTTPIPFGALRTGVITVSGETDCFTFTGAVGDVVRVRVIKTSGAFNPLAEVVRPNGQPCVGATAVDEFNCAVNSAGTHTIRIRDAAPGTRTGGYSLYIQRLNNPVGCTPITFGALPLARSITVAAEVDCYTFAGTVGDRVRVRMIKTSGAFLFSAQVVRPNGQVCVSGPPSSGELNCAVNSAGTHTILIRDASVGTRTGNYRLYIQRLNNPVGCTPITFGALPLARSITVAAEVDCYTFAGTVGDTVRVRVIKTSGTFNPLADVVRPNGQACVNPTAVDEFNCVVNSAGTHTILIRDASPGTRTGGYQVSIRK